ncbi:VOC family protein [Xenorhabdus bovienii]|uniref:VOC family protein n=1 Tax=Xenorhabdus bovienii TaxID=40576 RepID=UPI0023B275F6|nr:VOC family protein [Xenorhabdus bovienii]MDE9542788.1 VOC family protein [Xenorhabdus bovienii]MDE9552090.1 VOC family protein [Xenorhabdus bovienii]MDE9556176.1 VOC family protein [Xenorhabdus bovienii]MDE9563014.1 VOC family protein [Xenorhabdus bovienii]
MKILNILVRRYLPLEHFEDAVSFHEKITNKKARKHFDYDEYQLKLAAVSSILFIGGTEESLKPFTATNMTFLVEDIHAWEQHLPTIGAHVLEPIKTVPTGWNMLVRHPDNTLVEYVEHKDKHPEDNVF